MLIFFKRLFDVRKTKRIAKFDGLEPRRSENIKRIVAAEIGPKSFGTFEKQSTTTKLKSFLELNLPCLDIG